MRRSPWNQTDQLVMGWIRCPIREILERRIRWRRISMPGAKNTDGSVVDGKVVIPVVPEHFTCTDADGRGVPLLSRVTGIKCFVSAISWCLA